MTFLDYLRNVPAYLREEWPAYVGLARDHLQVVVVAMVVAAVVGVGLGVLTYGSPPVARVVLTVASAFLTIPSFALFGLFIPVLGLGYRPVVLALVLYALLPIVRN